MYIRATVFVDPKQLMLLIARDPLIIKPNLFAKAIPPKGTGELKLFWYIPVIPLANDALAYDDAAVALAIDKFT
jgi:hypothetical protein